MDLFFNHGNMKRKITVHSEGYKEMNMRGLEAKSIVCFTVLTATFFLGLEFSRFLEIILVNRLGIIERFGIFLRIVYSSFGQFR